MDVPYQALIGCLLYLSTNTRPDIAHVTSVLSQFNTNYTDVHRSCAKRVLRYLKGTMTYGLRYCKSGQNGFGITGFVDADHAGDVSDRKSYMYWVLV